MIIAGWIIFCTAICTVHVRSTLSMEVHRPYDTFQSFAIMLLRQFMTHDLRKQRFSREVFNSKTRCDRVTVLRGLRSDQSRSTRYVRRTMNSFLFRNAYLPPSHQNDGKYERCERSIKRAKVWSNARPSRRQQ